MSPSPTNMSHHYLTPLIVASSPPRTPNIPSILLVRPPPLRPSAKPVQKLQTNSPFSSSPVRTPSPTSPLEMASERVVLRGGCYCGKIQYELNLASKDDARTSLCHCRNCKKAFGGVFGVTVKVPITGFRYLDVDDGEEPKIHMQDNGSGTNLFREFCPVCGAYICEYGEPAKPHFRYLTLGSLDDPEALPPKGEFFCSQRVGWMPEVPGVFHKQKIKE